MGHTEERMRGGKSEDGDEEKQRKLKGRKLRKRMRKGKDRRTKGVDDDDERRLRGERK